MYTKTRSSKGYFTLARVSTGIGLCLISQWAAIKSSIGTALVVGHQLQEHAQFACVESVSVSVTCAVFGFSFRVNFYRQNETG